MNTANEISPLMRELSAYMADAPKRKLPGEVAERAKLHMLDTFAAMLSGSRLRPGKSAIAYVRSRGGPREAGVIGTRITTSVLNAALANGMFGHADETDDIHTPTRSHPGAGIVPAVLAVAEQQRLPGEAMLRAMTLGYELCARFLLTIGVTGLFSTGHHPGAKGGLFGAGAASGALLKLNARRMRYLLSYLAQQASGISTFFREPLHVEKAYVCGGLPAHNGVAAALLAASGFPGVEDVFAGECNFISTFSPNADREALVRGLGREFEIMRVRIKRWPVGGPIQGPLFALTDLMRRHGFRANDVEKLVARMPETDLQVVNDRGIPAISVQHLLALMLLDGTVTFASAHDYARIKDPKALELRQRIQMIGDPGLAGAVRKWRCVMEVGLKDGRRFAQDTAAPNSAFELPVGAQQVREKAFDLMAPVIGKRRSSELISALLNIETIKDARRLRRLYAL